MTNNGAGRVRRVSRAVAAAVVGTTMVVSTATPSFAAQAWSAIRNFKGTSGAQFLWLTIGGGLKGQATVHERVDSATQLWTFQESAEGYFFIRSGASTQQWALSILGNSWANKTPVVQYTYQPNNDYEKWEIEDLPGPSVHYHNVGAGGKCLAVSGGTANTLPNGSGVIIYDCGSGLDQEWTEFPQ